jgi:hypothetical protein
VTAAGMNASKMTVRVWLPLTGRWVVRISD